MKKVFLTFLTASFLATVMVSCQSEKKESTADSTEVVKPDSTKVADSLAAIPVVAPTQQELARAEVKAPTFSNKEVNDGLNEFAALKSEYENVLASNDVAATKALLAKYNAWVIKTAAYGSKLPASENQKFIDYYEKLALQWDIVARQAKSKK